MNFFREIEFKEILPLLHNASDDVIIERVLSPLNCRTTQLKVPSFIINGSFGNIDPKAILDNIAEKSNDAKEKLDSIDSDVFVSIKRMQKYVKNWRTEQNNSVLSFFCSNYSDKDLSDEELETYPFHAKNSRDGLVREISVARWDPWGERGSGWCSWEIGYRPFEEENWVAEQRQRKEIFQIEDIHSYIKAEGSVSLRRNVSGETISDETETIRAESRNIGARDGYYEIKDMFHKTTHNVTEGYSEILRKELHAVLPTYLIRYEILMEGSEKSQTIPVRVYKYDEEHLFVLFDSCPNIKRYNPVSKEVTSKRKQSFWDKLFKK